MARTQPSFPRTCRRREAAPRRRLRAAGSASGPARRSPPTSPAQYLAQGAASHAKQRFGSSLPSPTWRVLPGSPNKSLGVWLGAAAAEELDQPLDQLLRRTCAGGDPDGLDSLQPRLVNLKVVVDQVGSRPV